MNGPYKFSYTPLHSEILSNQRHAAARLFPKQHGAFSWILLFLILALFLGIVQFLILESSQAFMADYVGKFVAQLVPIAFIFVALPIWVSRKIKRRTSQLDALKPNAQVSLSVDNELMQWTSEHSGSWLSYQAIDRLFLSPVGIGLIQGGAVITISKRAVGDEEKFCSLVRYIFVHLTDEARETSLQDKMIRQIAG